MTTVLEPQAPACDSPPVTAWWCWEAYDGVGVCRIADRLMGWWAAQASQMADAQLAVLMAEVEPRYERLKGWRVRAWPQGRPGEFAEAHAQDWLHVLEQGPLARLRTSSGRPGSWT